MSTSPYLWNTTNLNTATNTTVQTAVFPMSISTCPLNVTNLNTATNATIQPAAFNTTERLWLVDPEERGHGLLTHVGKSCTENNTLVVNATCAQIKFCGEENREKPKLLLYQQKAKMDELKMLPCDYGYGSLSDVIRGKNWVLVLGPYVVYEVLRPENFYNLEHGMDTYLNDSKSLLDIKMYLVSIKSLSEIRTVPFWKDTKSLSEQRLDLDWDDNQSLFDLSQELGVNMYQLVAFIGLPSNFKLDQHWNDNKSRSDHFLLWPKTNDSGTLHCRFEKRHQILQMRISTIHIIQNSISGVKNSDPLCYEQKLKWVQLLRNPITVNFTHNGRVVFSRALFIAVRKLSARRAFYGGSELIMISNCQCLERKEIFESTIHTRATMEKYDADMCSANEPEAIFTDKVEFEITAVNTEILDANHNKQQCPTISMRATWMISSVHNLQQKLVSSESRIVLLIPRKDNNNRQQNVGEMIVQCLRGQRKFECFSLCTKPCDGYHCLRRRTPESIVLNTCATTSTNEKQHSCTTDEQNELN